VLDLCCGTAALALQVSEYAAPEVHVFGLDFNKAMLHGAMNKRTLAKRKERGRIRNGRDRVGVNMNNVGFILTDAAHLPFRDGCIDHIGTAFSFRNLIYMNPLARIYLKEILRTLRPGGKFVCVETSQPRRRPLRVLYHLYLGKIVPFIGGVVSRHKGAYRYLGTSAINFPSGEEIAEMLLSAGFREVSLKHMTLGVVGIHVGIK
jgi:demethylmenaquinone methyltransferase/2-methoxy-6-polyprenyl-1,4-benzoquinol methylase